MDMIEGRLEIEPFLIEGAFVFFIAANRSFGLPVSSIYGTIWQEEFESDFGFVWTNENRSSAHTLLVAITSSVYSKWLKRARCKLSENAG